MDSCSWTSTFSDLTFSVHLNEEKMFAIKYLCSNAAPHKGYCFNTIQTLQRDVGKHELLHCSQYASTLFSVGFSRLAIELFCDG